jgi:hypothetical protein
LVPRHPKTPAVAHSPNPNMSPTAGTPPFSADNPRMPLCRPLPSRGYRVLVRLLCVLSVLILTACGAAAPRSTDTTAIWAGRPIGQPPSPNARLKAAMVQRAVREWHQFDRQVVLFDGADESIPHVGAWEDDYTHSGRVNLYWRAVNKPDLVGMDCRQPWSAAFISWVMQSAGVPASQFRAAPAHWIYLSSMIEEASYPGRYFVPRRVQDYSPNPGDLICASRGQYPIRSINGYTSACKSKAPKHIATWWSPNKVEAWRSSAETYATRCPRASWSSMPADGCSPYRAVPGS